MEANTPNEMFWNSSQIKITKYNEEKKVLRVTFNNGGIYKYDGVPLELWLELIKAESVGKFFYAKVKGIFSFTKIK